MVKNIELRREYVKLVQQGKPKEAFAKLQEIWVYEASLVGSTIKVEREVVKEKTVEQEAPKVKKVNKKFSKVSDLSKIKGIGKETVKDIEKIYPTLEKLISELKNGNGMPFRNDIEKKLIKALL